MRKTISKASEDENVVSIASADLPPPDAAKAPSKFSRFKVSEAVMPATGEVAGA